jgi:hypothetical protein
MSRGGAANRKVVILMIQAAPPPRPACFADDKIWQSWLIDAHLTGLRVVRIVDLGKSQGCRQTSRRLLPTQQINYCDGCTQSHKSAMERAGKCVPSLARVMAEA